MAVLQPEQQALLLAATVQQRDPLGPCILVPDSAHLHHAPQNLTVVEALCPYLAIGDIPCKGLLNIGCRNVPDPLAVNRCCLLSLSLHAGPSCLTPGLRWLMLRLRETCTNVLSEPRHRCTQGCGSGHIQSEACCMLCPSRRRLCSHVLHRVVQGPAPLGGCI